MICQVPSELIVRKMEQLQLVTSPRKAATCEEQLGEDYFLRQLHRMLPVDVQGMNELEVLQCVIDYIQDLYSVLGEK